MEFVATLAPFCGYGETTKNYLKELMKDGEWKADDGTIIVQAKNTVQQHVYQEKRRWATEDKRSDEDAVRLPALETAAKQLIDTRDALATALKALAEPAGLPMPFPGWGLWYRSSHLDLSDVFLAGADLHGVHLQGVVLNNAWLQGVGLDRAHLQGALLTGQTKLQSAILTGTEMQGAMLINCQLQKADMAHAQLQGAALTGSQLTETKLTAAQMQGAFLNGINLERAYMLSVQLQGAHLSGAQLQGAYLVGAQLDQTKLYGVTVQRESTEGYRQTNFKDSAWNRADFSSRDIAPLSATKNQATLELKEWLAQFPQMSEDRIITYRAWQAKTKMERL